MTGTVAALRLDVWTVRPYRRQLVILVGAMAIVGVASGSPAALIIVAAVYVSFVSSYPFAIGDKNDLETLQATLPVRRTQLIAARYILTLLVWVVMTLVALGLGIVVATMHDEPGDPGLVWGEIIASIAVSAVMFATLVGLQLPVFYAIGYARARLVAYVPIMAVAGGMSAAGALVGDDVIMRLRDLAPPPTWVAVPLVCAVLVASALVSARLDARRRL
jgi:hypothetical protein